MSFVNVTLPAPLDEFVRNKVASGEFRSPADVVCEALRLLQEETTWQKQATLKIDEGWAQAEAGDTITPEQAREDLAARKKSWADKRAG
jgi:putative addiction module CopG family antidote